MASLDFLNLSGAGKEETGLKLNRDSQSPDPAITEGGGDGKFAFGGGKLLRFCGGGGKFVF